MFAIEQSPREQPQPDRIKEVIAYRVENRILARRTRVVTAGERYVPATILPRRCGCGTDGFNIRISQQFLSQSIECDL
jgi:hypothetical protein